MYKLDKLFKVGGRYGRLRYFHVAILASMVSMTGAVAGVSIARLDGVGRWIGAFFFVGGIIISAWIVISAAVRRLHDLGFSGLLVAPVIILNMFSYVFVHAKPKIWLLLLVGFANLIVVALVQFWPGQKSDNRFGPPPA